MSLTKATSRLGMGKTITFFNSVAGVGGGGHGWTQLTWQQQKNLVFAPFHCFMIESITDKAKYYFFVPSHIFRTHNYNVRTVAVS
jgi:hypothetical protein